MVFSLLRGSAIGAKSQNAHHFWAKWYLFFIPRYLNYSYTQFFCGHFWMGKRKPDRKYVVTKWNFNSTQRKFQNDENLSGKSPSDPPPQKLRKMSKQNQNLFFILLNQSILPFQRTDWFLLKNKILFLFKPILLFFGELIAPFQESSSRKDPLFKWPLFW